jgi:hypothetical protein
VLETVVLTGLQSLPVKPGEQQKVFRRPGALRANAPVKVAGRFQPPDPSREEFEKRRFHRFCQESHHNGYFLSVLLIYI